MELSRTLPSPIHSPVNGPFIILFHDYWSFFQIVDNCVQKNPSSRSVWCIAYFLYPLHLYSLIDTCHHSIISFTLSHGTVDMLLLSSICVVMVISIYHSVTHENLDIHVH